MRRTQLLLAGVALTGVVALVGSRGLARATRSAHSAFGHGPTIALVHGLGSRPEHWLPTARRLAGDHHVVLVDLPGHGLSEMPQPFSLERAVDAMDQALAAEASGPVVLVGHSIGGLVATRMALDHPERVRGLVLVETALTPQITGPERDSLLRRLDEDYRGVLYAVYTSFGRDSAQGLELYDAVAALDRDAIKRWIRLALTADLSQDAAGLNVPVLAILAERSWPENEPWQVTADALGYSRIPNVSAVRVRGCGHYLMLDRPGQVARAIARFAAKNGAPEPVAGAEPRP